MTEDSTGFTSTLSSRIASLVHAHFDGLPARSKPNVYPDGSREWIPMTGIVIVKGEGTPLEKLNCVVVTTGAKCLPASQIPKCRGLVLHDWHAEILALRAFNHWLLSECHGVLVQESYGNVAASPFIRRRHSQPGGAPSTGLCPPFELHPDIKIYMYCTCAPCGDASMELCMAAQSDPTPWTSTPESQETELELDGRGNFSRLGAVRRKPARADAEATRSKSCSDKLALRQISSLLSRETCLLVAPTRNAYLAGLILPDEEISRAACARCFGENGRMASLKGRSWPVGEYNYAYRFRPFEILPVPSEMVHSLWPFRKPRPAEAEAEAMAEPSKKSRPGNVSAIWTAAPSFTHPCPLVDTAKAFPVLRDSKTALYETIINGVKQGNRAASVTPRGASALSRAKIWGFLCDMLEGSCLGDYAGAGAGAVYVVGRRQDAALRACSYADFKTSVMMPGVKAWRDAVHDTKDALKGWIPNQGDGDWGLDVLVDTKRKR